MLNHIDHNVCETYVNVVVLKGDRSHGLPFICSQDLMSLFWQALIPHTTVTIMMPFLFQKTAGGWLLSVIIRTFETFLIFYCFQYCFFVSVLYWGICLVLNKRDLLLTLKHSLVNSNFLRIKCLCVSFQLWFFIPTLCLWLTDWLTA